MEDKAGKEIGGGRIFEVPPQNAEDRTKGLEHARQLFHCRAIHPVLEMIF